MTRRVEGLEQELEFVAAVQLAPNALTAAAALRRRDRERDEETWARMMATVIDLAPQVYSLGKMRVHLSEMLTAGESWVRREDDWAIVALCETGRREHASPEQRMAATRTEQHTPRIRRTAHPAGSSAGWNGAHSRVRFSETASSWQSTCWSASAARTPSWRSSRCEPCAAKASSNVATVTSAIMWWTD